MDFSEHWERAASTRGGSAQRAAFILRSEVSGVGRERRVPARDPGFQEEVCALTNALLSLVAWGLLFPSTASWIARESLKSGCNTRKINKFARFGASGESPTNSRRDLFRTFFRNISVPKPLSLRLKVLDGFKRIVDGQVSLSNPFDLLHSIWVHHRHIFLDVVGHNPRLFLESLRGDDPKLRWLPDHVLSVPAWQNSTWPIVIHGDATR